MRTTTAALTVAALAATLTGCGGPDEPLDDDAVARLIEAGSGIDGMTQADMEPLAQEVCLQYETLESRGTTGRDASWAIIDAHMDDVGQEMGGFIVLATSWKCPEYSEAANLSP